MAFYIKNISDENNDIRFHHSPCESSRISNSTTISGSSQFSTVRYINSVSFIEREDFLSPSSTRSDTYDLEVDKNNCGDGIFIPYLDIPDNESVDENISSTSNDGQITFVYSQRKVMEEIKNLPKPNAFEEWLVAKREEEKYKKLLEKGKQEEINELERIKKEQRKKLAEKKYKEWLERKRLSDIKKASNKKLNGDQTPTNGFYKTGDSKAYFDAWLKKKLEQEKEKNERKKQEIKLRQELEKVRKERANKVYQEWLLKSKNAPKHVPLNQGFLSLKGSMSLTYCNPIPWQSIPEERQKSR